MQRHGLLHAQSSNVFHQRFAGSMATLEVIDGRCAAAQRLKADGTRSGEAVTDPRFVKVLTKDVEHGLADPRDHWSRTEALGCFETSSPEFAADDPQSAHPVVRCVERMEQNGDLLSPFKAH